MSGTERDRLTSDVRNALQQVYLDMGQHPRYVDALAKAAVDVFLPNWRQQERNNVRRLKQVDP
jgi:hypothetical protein